jgi:signal transduction histidine kinase
VKTQIDLRKNIIAEDDYVRGLVRSLTKNLSWRKFLVVVGVWSMLGLLFTPQTYLVNLSGPSPLNWWQAFVSTLFPFLLWAILTAPIFWLCNRFPLENRHLVRRILLHFLFSLPIGITHLMVLDFSESLLLPWVKDYSPPIPTTALVVNFLANNIMFYWGIVAVKHAFNYFQKYQDREFRLVQAQMQALKNQLNPHFLFNTLNAISELVYSAPLVADKTITELSDLLRITLEKDNAQEISLKDEIEFLQKYLNIQQMLLDQRLKIQMDVVPETFDALVPNMILQPLVENAIRHGVAPRVTGGTIFLSAKRKNDSLEIRIEDDGLGFEPNWQSKNGIGLSNTLARLKHLYGENYRCNFEVMQTSGTKILIVIPFREQGKEFEYENSHFIS